ncbi:hypothetical protein Ais01nite_13060 [Asanoa ishikariensis]|uniref:DUF1963 domain-containing protein n=1 Tax=Asanoa ishikariensis TaxID=137265 RepID=A0A1H3SXM6_9ACTN|nr:hypothetical protein [Asanoa ishikariensis]GIF63271.1 hypothetical protein Ais01nite_13060 [Asanoa ishikariensis]SDZ42883.1 hypothetical protein SAMN05421684_4921 [Asanoa ishikariensis]
MTRTTPPRPVDIAELFPELREHSAMATRLHPRPGAPTAADSSVGGPLLWPADEPWPVCTDGAAHYIHALRSPATVRRSREIYAAARGRAFTEEERAQLPRHDFSEPHHLVAQPIPFVPVAQLYRRDMPDFAGPDGADVLQVLWCPLDHPEDNYTPRVRLYWRRSADVVAPLETPPEPPVVNDAYLPVACVVHPERVREYEYDGLLPEEVCERIAAWEKDDGPSYAGDLSLAPGFKVGGFASWSLSLSEPMNCAECGAAMTLLFTVDSAEWDRDQPSWRPLEEPADASAVFTEVVIGRGYSLYVFRCPASFGHPPATAME